MTDAISGAPNDSCVPKFLTIGHDFERRYLPRLIERFRGELDALPKESFVALRHGGLERKLVPEQFFRQLTNLGIGGIQARNIELIRAPLPASVAEVVQHYKSYAEAELPPEYVPKAMAAITAAAPKYAVSVEETVAALGPAKNGIGGASLPFVKYPTPPSLP